MTQSGSPIVRNILKNSFPLIRKMDQMEKLVVLRANEAEKK